MSTLRVRFAAMLGTAAVLPLLMYGVVSVYSLREGTRRTVNDGNLNLARQVGEQLSRYVSTNLLILAGLADDIGIAELDPDERDRILKNFILRFPEFREVTALAADGAVIATSRIGASTLTLPQAGGVSLHGVRISPVVVDADFLPTMLVAAPLGGGAQAPGWLVGELSIEELWRLVSRVRVGAAGHAMVVGPAGELLAHGNPDERPAIARGASLASDPVVAALRQAAPGAPVVRDRTTEAGEVFLSAGVAIPSLGWLVIVEQPAAEALAASRRQERDLTAAIALGLLVMVLAGLIWGRSLIAPIQELIRGTEAIAEGRLDERVRITSRSELGRLGDAFNKMAGRLGDLQEDVRRQERHAVFGRVAAGLVHDLSHPFKNIQNNCRLIVKMHDDPEYLELFRRTIDRECGQVKRVFEDLRNLARPMPMERFPLDLNRLAADVAESMRANAETAGLSLELDLAPGPLLVEGDVFALSRVCRNLVMNAIEATNPRGTVTIATRAAAAAAVLRVSDTGCGIAPARLETLFESFATTKRQGLGLGLAIAKKIVDQAGGTITASSVVGRGSAFEVTLALAAPAASGGETRHPRGTAGMPEAGP
ncbi:MAG TPA: sensor histidine kinase [Vicinamibacterales bacterium]|nr:sensor histidine kinase [Vicinamibacterales bacterium]HOQ59329.1 sensor histidine kinase [Vicinamibacterales bacterium]